MPPLHTMPALSVVLLWGDQVLMTYYPVRTAGTRHMARPRPTWHAGDGAQTSTIAASNLDDTTPSPAARRPPDEKTTRRPRSRTEHRAAPPRGPPDAAAEEKPRLGKTRHARAAEERLLSAAARLEASRHEGGGGDGGSPPWTRLWRACALDLWVAPRQAAVAKVVDAWWSRYGLLVLLPALLVRRTGGGGLAGEEKTREGKIVFRLTRFRNAPPLPPPPGQGRRLVLGAVPPVPLGAARRGGRAGDDGRPEPADGAPTPGHGAARVRVNFWFFLFVYYALYNLTALI